MRALVTIERKWETEMYVYIGAFPFILKPSIDSRYFCITPGMDLRPPSREANPQQIPGPAGRVKGFSPIMVARDLKCALSALYTRAATYGSRVPDVVWLCYSNGNLLYFISVG